MKKLLIPLAAVGLLAGSSAVALAQSSNSAKEFAPGQHERLPTDRGASNYAPGQLQTTPGTAKNFAPGQMKQETTGSAATTKSKSQKQK